MEMIRCAQCDKDFEDRLDTCPHCGAASSQIPNYPRFGGGVFIAMWIFFVVLIVVLLISMFTV